MTETQFWRIIEASRHADRETQLSNLRRALERLGAAEIAAFDRTLWQFIDRAYAWNLWGAAYVAMGGCSDDSFEYFRAWLVSRGRETYAAVVAQPDALAGVLPPDPEDMDFEDFLGIADDVHLEKTGQELPMHQRDRVESPRGTGWNFDDVSECRRRLPRLSARFQAKSKNTRKPWWKFW